MYNFSSFPIFTRFSFWSLMPNARFVCVWCTVCELFSWRSFHRYLSTFQIRIASVMSLRSRFHADHCVYAVKMYYKCNAIAETWFVPLPAARVFYVSIVAYLTISRAQLRFSFTELYRKCARKNAPHNLDFCGYVEFCYTFLENCNFRFGECWMRCACCSLTWPFPNRLHQLQCDWFTENVCKFSITNDTRYCVVRNLRRMRSLQ